MTSGKVKNKIYAIISISVIVVLIISFFLTANFLIKMNDLIFGVDEKLIKEKTTVLEISKYNLIKDKIESMENKNILNK